MADYPPRKNMNTDNHDNSRQSDNKAGQTPPPTIKAEKNRYISQDKLLMFSGLPAIMLLILFIALLFGASSWLDRQFEVIAADGMFNQVSEQDANLQASELTQRATSLFNPDVDQTDIQPESTPSWFWHLQTGRVGAADYILRLIISPEYLKQAPDDARFVQDLHFLLTGQVSSADLVMEDLKYTQETGSRLALINKLTEQAGYTGQLQLPSQTTRLRAAYVADDLPEAGSEIVGKLRVRTELRLTGPDARLKLYANAQIRSDRSVAAASADELQAFTIEWSAFAEKDGLYDLALLILTNDGRGQWETLQTYEVPVILPLVRGQLRQETLTADPNGSAARWYRLDDERGNALLNIFNASRPVQLELYDVYEDKLADTQSHTDLPAALRYRDHREENQPDLQGGEPLSQEALTAILLDEPKYFVKATPLAELSDNTSLSYTLMPALAVASPLDQPERYLAVHEIRETEFLVQDEAGRQSWTTSNAYRLYDPTAILGRLAFQDVRGDPVAFVPGFDYDNDFYALVVDEPTDMLSLTYQPLEGSAAEVRVFQETETSGRQLADSPITLAPSENIITLSVTGFDGRNSAYEINILRPPHSAGFDETLNQFHFTYRSWLWRLHLLRPAYRFEAFQTDIIWSDFMEAQTYRDRSLIDAAINPNSWVKSGSQVYDGASWKAASEPVVAYYTDPRNFINEIDVFQFESMTFDPLIHTKEGVQILLENSFMEAGNREQVDYAEILMEAAEVTNVSPFFLGARIIQEMGRQGQSPLAFGQLNGYEGIYNFYNINAIPNPDVPDGARINAARFAQFGLNPDQGEIGEQEQTWLIPWNSPERAIIGGAIWIAERYVGVGQDTLYVQKFDIIGSNGLYMRQYAQNIQMAWAEGQRTYTAYRNMDLLDEPFIFKIPVYRQMPETPGRLP